MNKRRAWVMKLKPGNEVLYKKKHDDIWPEMIDLMKKQGTISFSIYRYGYLLFAYQERDASIPESNTIDPIVKKWWKMMAPLMETNLDYSPVSESLEEMFYFNKGSK